MTLKKISELLTTCSTRLIHLKPSQVPTLQFLCQHLYRNSAIKRRGVYCFKCFGAPAFIRGPAYIRGPAFIGRIKKYNKNACSSSPLTLFYDAAAGVLYCAFFKSSHADLHSGLIFRQSTNSSSNSICCQST